MVANKLVLEIELGNDAMKDPAHVAEALAEVAKQVTHVAMSKGMSTKIMDVNGNTVGFWRYS
ncbi:MAG: hypothetical protein ACRDHW_17090 [Ktedonobacteraceae bacterium]